MNAPSLRTEHRQHQAITPRLQRAVRLLQLSSLDFAQEVHDAMGRNPFLEVDESAPDTPGAIDPAPIDRHAAQDLDGTDAPPFSPPDALTENHSTERELSDGSDEHGKEHDTEHDSADTWERDSWQQLTSRNPQGASEGHTGAMDLVAATPSLRAHLRSQANMLPLSARDHALVCAVIESLDDDGYLRLALEELGELAELDPVVDYCEMNTALRLVQSLEPCGVGARNVAECLMLQLRQARGIDLALARRIVTDHLERLAQRDVAGLARVLERTHAEVETACQQIRGLDPRPGWRCGSHDIQFITPDVVARKSRGSWRVQLNPAIVPKVRLNHLYADLFQRHRESQHGELAAHLQEARWTLRNVEQRFATIVMVAEAILKRQHPFLEYGPLAMKPLGLREIADDVGVHESTVCRVTNNKFMATPAGVFELKYFFSRAMPMTNGGSCSPTAIRGVIRDLIGGENPSAPLSDVDLARQLSRQGLNVARRTITKYRQLLKVPPADRRRRHVC